MGRYDIDAGRGIMSIKKRSFWVGAGIAICVAVLLAYLLDPPLGVFAVIIWAFCVATGVSLWEKHKAGKKKDE